MARRAVIKSVIHNFLIGYLSRNSDFNGYWLCGFFVPASENLSIHLLSEKVQRGDAPPLAAAKRIAVRKFAEQMEKSGFPTLWLNDACLDITVSPEPRYTLVNGHSCLGHDVWFTVSATTDLGKTYRTTFRLLIAPHNPDIERRSGRYK